MGHITKHRQHRQRMQQRDPRSRGVGSGYVAQLPVQNWSSNLPAGESSPVGLTAMHVWPDPSRYTRQDHWDWNYPVATSQYNYFNSWYGNQLPGFEKNPLHGNSQGFLVQFSQQQSEYQVPSKATTGMGSGQSISLLQRIQQSWRSQEEGE